MTTTKTAPPSTRPKITRRELEVLALIAHGYSTGEIAQALWITEDTVKTHVRRLLKKLGARTRAHAVAIAFQQHLWRLRNGDGEEGRSLGG